MAIQGTDGLYRGIIGNLLFRVVNGKQIVQARTANVNHSAGTKKSSKMFGLCSSQTTEIRGKLKPWMDGMCDRRVSSRFLGHCVRILKSDVNKDLESLNVVEADMTNLKGFEFNSNSPFSSYFGGTIGVFGEPNEGLLIKIPSFISKSVLKYPLHCQNVLLKLVVFHSSLGVESIDVVEQQEWLVEKNQELQEEKSISIAPIPTPGITLVLVQLLYFKNKSKFGRVYINNKNLHPMQVVYAR